MLALRESEGEHRGLPLAWTGSNALGAEDVTSALCYGDPELMQLPSEVQGEEKPEQMGLAGVACCRAFPSFFTLQRFSS